LISIIVLQLFFVPPPSFSFLPAIFTFSSPLQAYGFASLTDVSLPLPSQPPHAFSVLPFPFCHVDPSYAWCLEGSPSPSFSHAHRTFFKQSSSKQSLF